MTPEPGSDAEVDVREWNGVPFPGLEVRWWFDVDPAEGEQER